MLSELFVRISTGYGDVLTTSAYARAGEGIMAVETYVMLYGSEALHLLGV